MKMITATMFVGVAMMVASAMASSETVPTTQPLRAYVPKSIDCDVIRAMPVQYNGRICPLDTVARDVVWRVTGSRACGDADPIATLLAWTFSPEAWQQVQLIPVKSSMRGTVKLSPDQQACSYMQVMLSPIGRMAEHHEAMPIRRGETSARKKLLDRAEALGRVFANDVIRIVPDPHSDVAAWRAVGDESLSWQRMKLAFLDEKNDTFESAAKDVMDRLASLPVAAVIDRDRLALEVRYNAANVFHRSWPAMLVGAVLMIAGVASGRRGIDVVAFIALAAGTSGLIVGLVWRWQIAGYIPASNMIESLLFLSLGASLWSLLAIAIRNRWSAMSAAIIAAVTLMLSDVLPMDGSIRPVPPVLRDTIWMSIHVPVIMTSYAVLAGAVLIAHVLLVAAAVAPSSAALIQRISQLHVRQILAGSFLLTIGIATGSMWAASSWGRYWGWDAKEVWSLVALLAYLVILHVRRDRRPLTTPAFVICMLIIAAAILFVGPKLLPLTLPKLTALLLATVAMMFFVLADGIVAEAIKSIVAFWLIIMTYVGVNYVLGTGLHSYGGGGSAIDGLYIAGAVDLFVVGVCTLVYLWRSSASRSAAMA